jgi:hypothetical protein
MEDSYYNIDIGNVTITHGKQFLERMHRLFHGLPTSSWYTGWISESNPSKSKIGFYIAIQSDESVIYPDFHNLPFYYQNDFSGYMAIILDHLRRNGFSKWGGHMSPLQWSELVSFIDCLSLTPIDL